MRIVDFFCGAGGFSEGFRQQGFKVEMGIDNWRPAVEAHNLNFGLNDSPKSVLDFEGDVKHIEEFIPDTEIIIGSPPCVSFSMANKAGKADKSLGIRLIEAYLRVVAVKKHKKKSILKAWFMENVPNSRNFVKENYTFNNLSLGKWAKENKLNPNGVALKVKLSGDILCAADYGSAQTRDRFVCGEFIATGNFLNPVKTHRPIKEKSKLQPYITLKDIKGRMPSPYKNKSQNKFVDPNYSGLVLSPEELTDHFYDTGVYKIEWERAKEAKVNHPFMGKMSFPEDENRPSRTIMATRSASTREALIYKSEYKRVGNGEYRMPTIREAATLMGFPYTYQFVGGEGTKWKLIGNAVCPHMSAALARELRKALKLTVINQEKVDFKPMKENYLKVNNLNSSKEIEFNKPPKRGKNAKFRRHPIKAGNMTVALTNYDPLNEKASAIGKEWFTSVFLGSGGAYKIKMITKKDSVVAKQIIEKYFSDGKDFIKSFEKKFNKNIGKAKELQEMYEQDKSTSSLLEPTKLINEIAEFILVYAPNGEKYIFGKEKLIPKEEIPKSQLLAIYSLGKITC